MTAVIPTGSAHAISRVECGPSDYLEVYTDIVLPDGWWTTHVDCFANKGYYDFGGTLVVNKISTGNNAVKYYDDNGVVISYPKNFIITFPNRPPHVHAIEIL
jgi:hypothetical protein